MLKKEDYRFKQVGEDQDINTCDLLLTAKGGSQGNCLFARQEDGNWTQMIINNFGIGHVDTVRSKIVNDDEDYMINIQVERRERKKEMEALHAQIEDQDLIPPSLFEEEQQNETNTEEKKRPNLLVFSHSGADEQEESSESESEEEEEVRKTGPPPSDVRNNLKELGEINQGKNKEEELQIIWISLLETHLKNCYENESAEHPEISFPTTKRQWRLATKNLVFIIGQFTCHQIIRASLEEMNIHIEPKVVAQKIDHDMMIEAFFWPKTFTLLWTMILKEGKIKTKSGLQPITTAGFRPVRVLSFIAR